MGHAVLAQFAGNLCPRIRTLFGRFDLRVATLSHQVDKHVADLPHSALVVVSLPRRAARSSPTRHLI
jgi:hypothetical protein